MTILTLRGVRITPDLDEAIHEFSAQHTEIDSDAFLDLGLRGAHVVVFMRDGKIQDATASPSSPGEVAEHFETVAGPLVTHELSGLSKGGDVT
jgi:hypothetical protein